MSRLRFLKSVALGSASVAMLATGAFADEFNVPGGDLKSALNAYAKQARVALIVSADVVKGVHTKGVQGDLPAEAALSRILDGTGLVTHHHSSGAVTIVRDIPVSPHTELTPIGDIRVAAATAATSSEVESVVVTSSKIKGDIQTVPISITALSQEQLTARQIAGGPDLVREVPNLTFSKTNFTGYNIQIRGIGTQAISVTTDPAVAVAFNDTPFIRNHFFEQEFYDVSQVEVLRGPQGTLYGRNATAGVVNLVSAKPTDQFEAMASVDIGNYNNRRLEGMLNIPIVGDKLDLRVAGEWTKRDGYAFNEATDHSIDGRDLWSGRVSLLVHPIENLTANFVWEHFSENDDRARSTKQLCTRHEPPAVIDGPAGPQITASQSYFLIALELGCAPGPLYGPSAFQTPSAAAIPFVVALTLYGYIPEGLNPYADLNQSQDLRVVSSLLDPKYRAKNDTFELNADYNVTPTLTLTSQSGYNKDMLYSTEDYNRFNTATGIFTTGYRGAGFYYVGLDGEFCDPQLGCSSRLVAQDLSQERAWQFSQELRLASNFSGPLNFSIGTNYLHYQTVEDYYVFINAISLFQEIQNINYSGTSGTIPPTGLPHAPFDPVQVNSCNPQPADRTTLNVFGTGCGYVDPNPIDHLDGQGHNYFRSQNPYRLNSWAGFGEVYYQVAPDLKLTGGLRWTDDMKTFTEIPSWTALGGKGYPIQGVVDPAQGVVDQQWKEWTGRFVANWTPKLDFTDATMVYSSYSRGYKGGGANPPGVTPLPSTFVLGGTSPSNVTHPLTFKPEFVDAFELGTKNTLLDGAMTFNADIFYYKYQSYQISQIVDRTSVNLNFDAHVRGAEVEATWEPVPGLRLNLSTGYENATLDNGSKAIDLMDRTAGNSDWIVLRPFPTMTSNCIVPVVVLNEIMAHTTPTVSCLQAYSLEHDPVTWAPYVAYPDQPALPGYAGFDPTTAPNNGQGFEKDLSGNQLPSAPHFTTSLGGQYTTPLSEDWAATLRGDFYWQSQSFARVYNFRPHDKIRGYSTTNLSLVFSNADGWEVMAYMKNVFDTTAITGAFLNSDDTGLTTNVFVTDPRLFGLRVTKTF